MLLLSFHLSHILHTWFLCASIYKRSCPLICWSVTKTWNHANWLIQMPFFICTTSLSFPNSIHSFIHSYPFIHSFLIIFLIYFRNAQDSANYILTILNVFSIRVTNEVFSPGQDFVWKCSFVQFLNRATQRRRRGNSTKGHVWQVLVGDANPCHKNAWILHFHLIYRSDIVHTSYRQE